MILESGMQMSKLIDTLLDFTRTRLGRPLVIKRELMDLRAILQQTIESMAAAYPGRSIRLDCSGSLQCAVDNTRIRQLFSNLVANAIQHGAETSPVTLRAHIESGDIVVRVHNDGPPIPPSEIPKLFEFLPKNMHEDVAHKSEFRHLGIGLYITRKIVEAHSGTISVTSTQKDGTTFEVRLPCSAST
jgi:signal transduction histidine kinase